jgi:hypothetical protein
MVFSKNLIMKKITTFLFLLFPLSASGFPDLAPRDFAPYGPLSSKQTALACGLVAIPLSYVTVKKMIAKSRKKAAEKLANEQRIEKERKEQEQKLQREKEGFINEEQYRRKNLQTLEEKENPISIENSFTPTDSFFSESVNTSTSVHISFKYSETSLRIELSYQNKRLIIDKEKRIITLYVNNLLINSHKYQASFDLETIRTAPGSSSEFTQRQAYLEGPIIREIRELYSDLPDNSSTIESRCYPEAIVTPEIFEALEKLFFSNYAPFPRRFGLSISYSELTFSTFVYKHLTYIGRKGSIPATLAILFGKKRSEIIMYAVEKEINEASIYSREFKDNPSRMFFLKNNPESFFSLPDPIAFEKFLAIYRQYHATPETRVSLKDTQFLAVEFAKELLLSHQEFLLPHVLENFFGKATGLTLFCEICSESSLLSTRLTHPKLQAVIFHFFTNAVDKGFLSYIMLFRPAFTIVCNNLIRLDARIRTLDTNVLTLGLFEESMLTSFLQLTRNRTHYAANSLQDNYRQLSDILELNPTVNILECPQYAFLVKKGELHPSFKKSKILKEHYYTESEKNRACAVRDEGSSLGAYIKKVMDTLSCSQEKACLIIHDIAQLEDTYQQQESAEDDVLQAILEDTYKQLDSV